MFNDVKIFEDFLAPQECSDILNKCKNELELTIAGIAEGNPNERKSSIGWVDELYYVNERLKKILKESFNINGMEISGLGPFQFTEYKIGEYYGWHSDRTATTFRDRFVSTVITLNDDYDGGLLEIKDSTGDLIPMKYKIGTLYVFDSILKHRVTPVNSGIRYSLVNWVSLNKTDINKQNLL